MERKRSKLEQQFKQLWNERPLKGITWIEQYKFAPGRKFLFDFALPSLKLAVELDGYGWGHQSPWAITNDHEKTNLAQSLGWIVLRYTPTMLSSQEKRESVRSQIWEVIMKIEAGEIR